MYQARGHKSIGVASQAPARQVRVPAFGLTVLWISGSNLEQERADAIADHLGVAVRWVSGASQALYELRDRPVMLCLLDCARGSESLRIARTIRTERPQAVLIGVVDADRPESSLDAFRAGVFDVLPAPIVPGDLAAVMSNAQDLAGLNADLENVDQVHVAPFGVFGASPAMRKILDLLRASRRAAVRFCSPENAEPAGRCWHARFTVMAGVPTRRL